MEYKFNEEVKKAMRRQGGESNDIVQSIAKDAYKKGYEGLQEGIFVGSVEMKGLYKRAYNQGKEMHDIENTINQSMEKFEKDMREAF